MPCCASRREKEKALVLPVEKTSFCLDTNNDTEVGVAYKIVFFRSR